MTRRQFTLTLAAPPVRPLPLILDTDLGADVDDAFALIYLVNSPEIDLRAVTTVMRNTHRRAQYARRLLDILGRGPEVACAAGCPFPLTPSSGRRNLREDAARVSSLPMAGYGDDDHFPESVRPAIPPAHAADLIIDLTRQPFGPRHLLVIGAQTNVAMALLKDPSLASRLDAITLMGYHFRTGLDPYNVGWDLDAARIVLSSGVPLRVVPTEIGLAAQMSEEEYQRLLASTCPHLQFVQPFLRRWVRHVRTRPGDPVPDYCPRPYDSLAAMTLTHPRYFEWKRGRIELSPQSDPKLPNTRFTEDPAGPHEIAVAVDRSRAMALHEQRLLACSRH